MGLRLRVGAGPVSASTGLSGKQSGGCLAVIGGLFALVAPVAFLGAWSWFIYGPALAGLVAWAVYRHRHPKPKPARRGKR